MNLPSLIKHGLLPPERRYSRDTRHAQLARGRGFTVGMEGDEENQIALRGGGPHQVISDS